MKEIYYKNLRPELQTGDLVFFNGKGLFGWAIKFFSHSKITHVGIVVKREDIKFDLERYREGSVLLFESTTLGKTKDIILDKNKKGVQLVYLSDKIKDYDGSVYIKRFKGSRTEKMIIALNEFLLFTHARKYELKISELFLSCFRFIRLPENLKSIFCSELASELFQRMGIISDKYKSNNFTPARLYNFKEFKKWKPLRVLEIIP